LRRSAIAAAALAHFRERFATVDKERPVGILGNGRIGRGEFVALIGQFSDCYAKRTRKSSPFG